MQPAFNCRTCTSLSLKAKMKKKVDVKSKQEVLAPSEEEDEDSIAESDVEDEEVAEDEDDAAEEDEADSDEDALDASATESDSAGSESLDDNDKAEDAESAQPKKSTVAVIEETLLQKYQERQGKQLYIRFPQKLPEDEKAFQQKVKTLSPLVVKGNKPRQRHARFCLVDFNSKEDRDAALQALETAAATDAAFKGIVAKIPHTESTDYLKELAERKLRTIENKKAKLRLKRSSKAALLGKNFTSSIVVLNLPQNSSTAEVRKLFPSAVDIQLKPQKSKLNSTCLAAVTLPSTIEARSAVKRKLSLGGNDLKIRFDLQKNKKSKPTKRKWDGKNTNKQEIKSKKPKI